MLYGGIDWGDRSLAFHLRTAEGKERVSGEVTADADGLAELFLALEKHAPPEQIALAIETRHGAWMQGLLDRGYAIYPVNPKTVERFREACSANGDKADSIDARILAMYLIAFLQRLRPLKPDAPEIVALRIACEDRVKRVEERTAKLNELLSVLKAYYPAFRGLFGDHASKIALEFLLQFPTQNQMLELTPRRLRGWLERHGYSHPERIEEMTASLTQKVLLVADHLQQAKAPTVSYLAGALLALGADIDRRDRHITGIFEALPEADWIRSLPGGEVLHPALLACLGRDPQRFQLAPEAQAFFGTAPVTKSSGNSRQVKFRRGCWKFARRTLQLFANASRQTCAWAEELYQACRARGQRHHEALRALANRWLKIIVAMRRTGSAYDETIYQQSRQRHLLKSAAPEA